MHKYHRRSIRLKEYDYTQPGAYFLTIVTGIRLCIFGEVLDGEVHLSQMGEIARKEWERLPNRFDHLQLDEFIVMPNHVHGIIFIKDDAVGAQQIESMTELSNGPAVPLRNPIHFEKTERFSKPVPGSIPTIMRSYKSAVSLRCNFLRKEPDAPVWQRNYYEHIIRNEAELNDIRAYIINNPNRWDEDEYRPG